MRWQGRKESDNVEDRRGRGPSGPGRLALNGPGKLAVALIILLAAYYGLNLSPLMDQGGGYSYQEQGYQPSEQEEEMARFSAVALKMTEEAWRDIFKKMRQEYTPPKLVLYSGSTSTTCGYGQSAMGPFYCPADQAIYIDLSFYQDMKKSLGGGGDFAQGYVIAHEVAHHAQNLLGITKHVRAAQSKSSQVEARQLSVNMELQADCFAGVWGKYVENEGILEPGDVEEALSTAQAIGDDRLQKESGGQVVPDSFTHGTSAQRYKWFKRGFDSGDINVCNTFSADD